VEINRRLLWEGMLIEGRDELGLKNTIIENRVEYAAVRNVAAIRKVQVNKFNPPQDEDSIIRSFE